MSTDKLSDQAAAGRSGYSAEFLGQRVDPPTIDEALQDDSSEIIPYTHFSLGFNQSSKDGVWGATGRRCVC